MGDSWYSADRFFSILGEPGISALPLPTDGVVEIDLKVVFPYPLGA
jgi:hypothetical protein